VLVPLISLFIDMLDMMRRLFFVHELHLQRDLCRPNKLS
jgi:hypothetical protein